MTLIYKRNGIKLWMEVGGNGRGGELRKIESKGKRKKKE